MDVDVKETVKLAEIGGYGSDRNEGVQRDKHDSLFWDCKNYNDHGNNRKNSEGHQEGNHIDYVVGGGAAALMV